MFFYVFVAVFIIGFLINVQVQGQHPHQWALFQETGLLHVWQISHQISRYVYHEGRWPRAFHSLQFLSVSCFHVILGLPGPCFPSTRMSKAAPLERSTSILAQPSLLQNEVQILNAKPRIASSSLDLVVTMSCGLTLQICLIIALSFHCRRWRFGFVSCQVSLA